LEWRSLGEESLRRREPELGKARAPLLSPAGEAQGEERLRPIRA
jgi:hypothetical protein